MPGKTTYSGDPIVPEKSILRQMPSLFEGEERVRLDALAYSCDIIESTFRSLRIAAEAIARDEENSNKMRPLLFGSAWTLVDQLHVARQLINNLPEGKIGALGKAFCDLAAPVHGMRNKMDHLNALAGNLAAKKEITPIFGAISFAYFRGHPPLQGSVFLLTTGLIKNGHRIPLVNPGGRKLSIPVGLLQLTAFEYQIEFEPAIAALYEYVQDLQINVEIHVKDIIRKFAEKEGITAAEVPVFSGSSIFIRMDVEFSEQPGINS